MDVADLRSLLKPKVGIVKPLRWKQNTKVAFVLKPWKYEGLIMILKQLNQEIIN
jgi:hypothetical protein